MEQDARLMDVLIEQKIIVYQVAKDEEKKHRHIILVLGELIVQAQKIRNYLRYVWTQGWVTYGFVRFSITFETHDPSSDGGLTMHANRKQVFPSWILRSLVHTVDLFEKGIVVLFALGGDRYTSDIVSVGVEIER